jgi:hypothetical protein
MYLFDDPICTPLWRWGTGKVNASARNTLSWAVLDETTISIGAVFNVTVVWIAAPRAGTNKTNDQ